MASFIQHTECPRCRSNGNDRSGNNLGVYSDGSKYCFKCGYYVPAKGIDRLHARHADTTVGSKVQICLPEDSDSTLPRLVRDYLDKFQLTDRDIQQHTILWSEKWQRVIFPYFDSTGLLGWQGRYLGIDKTKSKWYSQGDLKSILHIVGNPKSSTCVITEDVISAIKVGHLQTVAASPLFGSHLSTQRILQLKHLYDTLLIWLDPDMRIKSSKFAQQVIQLGLKCRTIYSEVDPKECDDSDIQKSISQ